MNLGPTAHVDSFARDNLPPRDQWPEFNLEGFDYPEHLNAAVELTDRMVEKGYTEKQVRLLCEWYLRVRKSS